jgi:acetylcholinesterase
MFQAYPDDPSQGCPYDGRNTTYGQPSQFKRMAAIMTDSTYTEAWTEYLKVFGATKTWGILFDEPIPGSKPAYGVQHGSDLVFYFPTLLGPVADPRNNGLGALVDTLQSALVHFVNDLDPNGGDYTWPMYADAQQVTSLSARGPAAVDVPHRPGFDVLRQFLRPDGFA